jgi:hypothetical protein
MAIIKVILKRLKTERKPEVNPSLIMGYSNMSERHAYFFQVFKSYKGNENTMMAISSFRGWSPRNNNRNYIIFKRNFNLWNKG